jgi:hypothetical protein
MQTETLLRASTESAEIHAAELLRANQEAVNEVAPVFQAKAYASAVETEEVLESRIGGK